MGKELKNLGDRKMQKHWFSVQLKPVGSKCNLECRYCYAKPHLVPGPIMPKTVLERIVSQCMNTSPYPTFSWHGGEPILAGYDFFDCAMEMIEKYRQSGQKVRNLIQTNATKITPELAMLFKRYDFGVSVSLDGPEHVNGINRIFGNGENSFAEVMRGIKLLRETEIDTSVICTVSRETLLYAVETFDFLIDQGFKKIKYSPVFDSVNDSFSLTNDEWLEYLKAVFHRWFEVGDLSIQVRDLDEVIIWLSNKSFNLCSSDRTCLHWVSIDPNGEIYPCEYLRMQYYYGNIAEVGLTDVVHTATFQKFRRVYKTVPQKCQECKFHPLCGNGCPAIRTTNGRISPDGVYAFCEQRQQLFREIQQVFNATIEGGEQS